jgi:hypothetical protein
MGSGEVLRCEPFRLFLLSPIFIFIISFYTDTLCSLMTKDLMSEAQLFIFTLFHISIAFDRFLFNIFPLIPLSHLPFYIMPEVLFLIFLPSILLIILLYLAYHYILTGIVIDSIMQSFTLPYNA